MAFRCSTARAPGAPCAPARVSRACAPARAPLWPAPCPHGAVRAGPRSAGVRDGPRAAVRTGPRSAFRAGPRRPAQRCAVRAALAGALPPAAPCAPDRAPRVRQARLAALAPARTPPVMTLYVLLVRSAQARYARRNPFRPAALRPGPARTPPCTPGPHGAHARISRRAPWSMRVRGGDHDGPTRATGGKSRVASGVTRSSTSRYLHAARSSRSFSGESLVCGNCVSVYWGRKKTQSSFC